MRRSSSATACGRLRADRATGAAANVGNVLLEQKVTTMPRPWTTAAAQTAQIVTAAGLDAEALGRAHAELEGDLARKNELLRDAKYDRVRAQKAYNDAPACASCGPGHSPPRNRRRGLRCAP